MKLESILPTYAYQANKKLLDELDLLFKDSVKLDSENALLSGEIHFLKESISKFQSDYDNLLGGLAYMDKNELNQNIEECLLNIDPEISLVAMLGFKNKSYDGYLSRTYRDLIKLFSAEPNVFESIGFSVSKITKIFHKKNLPLLLLIKIRIDCLKDNSPIIKKIEKYRVANQKLKIKNQTLLGVKNSIVECDTYRIFSIWRIVNNRGEDFFETVQSQIYKKF